jgi:hypothetical protein
MTVSFLRVARFFTRVNFAASGGYAHLKSIGHASCLQSRQNKNNQQIQDVERLMGGMAVRGFPAGQETFLPKRNFSLRQEIRCSP